jgi:hypothetical protein
MILFGEQIESGKILQLLSRAIPYYMQSWHATEDSMGIFGSLDPQFFNMHRVGSSSPVIEYVIRPHLHVLGVLAALLHKDHFPQNFPITRDEALDKLRKGVAWACATHLTGTTDVDQFLERKRWGENWRSSVWASMLGIIGFLASRHLNTATLDSIKKIIAFEADRFIDVLPPDGCEIDTKLEENAQDTMLMSWAINMLPNHPHNGQWREALARWALNIASNFQDRADHSEYLEQSVSAYVSTQTLYPDMTAENHGFFHPEVLTYSTWVVLAMAAYTLHGNDIPHFFRRKNHQETFDVLLRFCLPTGMIYAPGGYDLPMFLPRPFALAWGLWNNDPRALRLTSRLLTWMDTVLPAQKNFSSKARSDSNWRCCRCCPLPRRRGSTAPGRSKAPSIPGTSIRTLKSPTVATPAPPAALPGKPWASTRWSA